MAGLFDGISDDAKLGLLTAALAAMSGTGARPGTLLARGGLLGLAAMQNARAGREDAARQQREDEFRQMQMDEYRRKIAEQQERQQGIQSAYRGAITPEQPPVEFGGGEGTRPGRPASFDPQKFALALGNVDPLAAAQMLTPKAEKSPWAEIDPAKYTPASLRAFAQSRNPADLVARESEPQSVGKINPSDFTPQSVQAFIASGSKDYGVLRPIDKRPVSSTTVHMPPAETEEAKAVGKGRGETFNDLQKRGLAAQAKINQLTSFETLMRGIDTNQMTPAMMTVAGYGRAFGVELDPKLGAKQAAETISNKLTLDARSTAEGAGMPGAMSDADREFLRRSVPNLQQTPEGRALTIEINRRIAKREAQVAAQARAYRQKNGKFDEGFYDELQRNADANPLFADLQAGAPAPASKLSPAEQAELEALRKRFGRK